MDDIFVPFAQPVFQDGPVSQTIARAYPSVRAMPPCLPLRKGNAPVLAPCREMEGAIALACKLTLV
ncbi:MAG: hypothetical protein VKJ64_09505 [Leptolyngbyaceae bacterium]|nr:hypothetical protein [Leptolyngbyaceae bacterium]